MNCLSLLLFLLMPGLLSAEERYTAERLQDELASPSVEVRQAAVRDVLNQKYRSLSADEIVPILEPFIAPPESKTYRVQQGLLIEHLGHTYGHDADSISSVLLHYAVDVKTTSYLRGISIRAAAKVVRDREKLVKVLIKTIENPIPKSTTGVHDVAVSVLGEMGTVALPAKPSIEKLRNHHFEMTRYAVLVALGQLQLAEHPLTDQAALQLLRNRQQHSEAEIASALLYFQREVPVTARGRKPTPAEIQKQANRQVIPIISARRTPELARFAASTLLFTGMPGDLESFKVVLKAMMTHDLREARQLITNLKSTDPRCVPLLRAALKSTLEEGTQQNRTALIQALQSFGPQAVEAAPELIATFQTIKQIRHENDEAAWQFSLILETLHVIGADDEIRSLVQKQLPGSSALMTASGKYAWIAETHLLRALSLAGLPNDPTERDKFYQLLLPFLQRPLSVPFREATATLAKHGDQFQLQQREELGKLLYDKLVISPAQEQWQFGAEAQTMDYWHTHLQILQAIKTLNAPAGEIQKVQQIAALPLPKLGYDFRTYVLQKQIVEARSILEMRKLTTKKTP